MGGRGGGGGGVTAKGMLGRGRRCQFGFVYFISV